MKQDIHTYTHTHIPLLCSRLHISHTYTERVWNHTHSSYVSGSYTHARVLERIRGEGEIIIFVCCGTLLVIACVGFRFGRFVPFHQQICWWFVYGCPITTKHHKNTNIIISLSSLVLSMLCAVCVWFANIIVMYVVFHSFCVCVRYWFICIINIQTLLYK